MFSRRISSVFMFALVAGARMGEPRFAGQAMVTYPPTPRQGDDGRWRTFHTLALTTVPGEQEPSILIIWDETGAPTITSVVSPLSPAITHVLEQSRDDQTDADA